MMQTYNADMIKRSPAWILIQAQLREVGINVDLKVLEQSAMDTVRYEFDQWDILSETVGGGKYLANTIKK